MTDETQAQPSETPPAAPRKWAGKFDTPEALEDAYKNTAKVYQENQEIKEKYESFTKVPEAYVLPQNVILNAREREILDRAAKKAGLNQDHYTKVAEEFQAEEAARKQAIENRRKSLGEDKVNVLHDYVQKFIPESLRDVVFNKLIEDDTAMSDAMNDRDKRMNSEAPGMGAAGGGGREPRYDGEKDLHAARENYRKYPNAKNKEKYIKMAAEVGAVRFPGKS